MVLGRQRLRRAGIAMLSAFLAFASTLPLAAQTETVLDKDDAVQTLEQRQKGLEATHERQKELEGNLKSLAKERDELNRALIVTASSIQESEERLTGMEGRLSDLGEQRKLLQGSFAAQAQDLGRLLAALQRMGSNPPPAMITHRKDALAMVRSAMMLATVFPDYREKALALKHKLDELDAVITAESTQRDKIKSEHDSLAIEQARIDPMIEAKQIAIADAEKELSSVRDLAKAQAKSVIDVRDLIRKLDKEIAAKTKLGEYETELAEAVLSGKSTEATGTEPALDSGTSTLGLPAADAAAPTEGDAPVAQKALAADVAFLDPGRIKPAIPFGNAKGLLPLPVRGERILAFGQQTRSGSKSKGVAFATRDQAQITSPCDGWVVYAGEFRSYDQVLIINAGGGYHLLLAGMAQINMQVGQFVLSGEPVGKMGTARPAADGSANAAPPILYLELRSKERPINPDPWWGPSGQKVANG